VFLLLSGLAAAAPPGLAEKLATIRRTGHMQIGVSVVNIESGQRVDIDGNRPYPLASVFKLPVMIELAHQVQHHERGLSLQTPLTVTADVKCLGSGELKHARLGTTVTLARAVELMETISDNTAADLVFNTIGVDSVNRLMHGLGFVHSNIYLTNRAAWLISLGLGRDLRGLGAQGIIDRWTSWSQAEREAEAGKIVEENKGLSLSAFQAAETASESRPYLVDRMVAEVTDNQASPSDIADLLVKLYKGELLDRQWTDYCLGVLSRQKYNSRIPRLLPAGTVVYHKTGTLEGIVNDAGIIELGPDNHVVVVVFVKRIARGADGEAGTAIARIARAAYDAWR
jgi:beta-lactamase class A